MAAFDVVAQAACENVRYIEIRFAPVLSTAGDLTVSQATEAVIAGLHQAMAQFDIIAKALVCGMRQLPNADNAAMFTANAPLVGDTLVGGDLPVTRPTIRLKFVHLPLKLRNDLASR